MAVVLVLDGGALVAVRQWLQAPATLFRNYDQDRRKARAAIEGEHVVPALAGLIVRVNRQAGLEGFQDQATVEATMQSVGYLASLQRLSGLYGDYADIERLCREALNYARWKGIAAIGFLVSFTLVVAWLVLQGPSFSWPLIATAVFAIASSVLSVAAWAQESLIYNRLTTIFERY
jgi:hypothetical protein